MSGDHEIAPGVLRLEKALPNGWGLNMILARLPDGGLLVYGPTWLGDATFDRVDALGTVRVIVAPNHYHHLSLARFRARYPEAIAVAGEAALPRLRAKGHEGVLELSAADGLLPPGAAWLRCESAKNGEAWLTMPGEGGPTWIVGDAFFNIERKVTGFTGVMLRALQTVSGLAVGKTFRWLALRDVAAYRAFALDAIARERPACMVPSHGEPLASAELPSLLEGIVRARL